MTREEITKEAQKQVNYCTPIHPEDFIHGYIAGVEPREKRIEELKEELKNWKDEWQEQVQKAIDEGYARTQQTIQLTNAKEIIKGLLSCCRNYPQENAEKMEQAEQFLNSEV